jgi:glyoxylase-like metal-dependent hydrolase (beta-lactamase superfamily II)
LLHFHSYLVTSDRGAVLVDTGIGPVGSQAAEWLGTAGRLPTLLASAGVGVDEIDTVILTHVHLDHAGWNTSGNQPRFGNATYVVQQAELDHLGDGPAYERYLQPIAAAGQLRAVSGSGPLDDLRLLLTPGHTPGHQCVVTDVAILGGDVLVHPAQARWPDLTYVYERNPAVAITSRHDVLALAATTGIPIAAAHPHTPATSSGTALQSSANPAPVGSLCSPHRL